MRLLLLGPPGSGKGTQAKLLSAAVGVRHISSGDLLRREVSAGTPWGKEVEQSLRSGELVPDDLVLSMLRPHILAASAAGGYLLDGFPRTLAQAESATEMARAENVLADAAVFLRADPNELVDRLLKRAQELGRSDDNAQTIRRRIEVYEAQTAPLRDYYGRRGILLDVDGLQPVEAVTSDIMRGLGLQTRVPPA